MIRKATIEDKDIIISMAIQFANESPYSGFVSLNKIEGLVDSILTSSVTTAAIFLDSDNRGMLVGCYSPHLFLEGNIATELAWWVSPEYRKSNVGTELLKAFEQWAKEENCEYITMISLDDSVGNIYENNGYSLQERAYWKVLI